MTVLFRVEGKMSTFGGPKDTGVKVDEGLALFASETDMMNHGLADYLLSAEQAGANGLARRLDPEKFYFACRWWEAGISKADLKNRWGWVENVKSGERVKARPVDSGPHQRTNRVADLSPGLAQKLGLQTDDICSVTITDEVSEFGLSHDHNDTSLKIYQTHEWGAEPAKVSYFPRSPGEGVLVHNTEGKNRSPLEDPVKEKEAAFETARRIQRSHMSERGFSDTGQHFTISQGGIVMEGRHGSLEGAMAGQVVRGAHCPGKNDEWWGIELAGDNREKFVVTSQQWDALIDLCAWLCRKTQKTLQLEPHNRFRDTTCPGHIGSHLPELRAAVEERLAALP